MSSLIRCTDDLLQQKAVQSSHYERLERQLSDGERCRRAAVLSLRQRVADVTRRGEDVVELRRENQRLTDQLSQRALQLAALQCRNEKAKRRESAAVERLQDGIRTFSGHPARIVLLVQALRAQKELHRTGQQFTRELQLLWDALRVHQEALAIVTQSAFLLGSQAALRSRLTAVLSERSAWCLQVRQEAFVRTKAATSERMGRVVEDQGSAQRELLHLDAEAGFLSIYAGCLDGCCEAAKTVVEGLSAAIDTGDEALSAMGQTLQEKTAAVAEAKCNLATEQAAHFKVLTLHQMELARVTEEVSAAAALEGLADARAAELQRLAQNTEKQAQLLGRRVYAFAFLMSLCERQQLRLARQLTSETEERLQVHRELLELRTLHEKRLERLRVAREAAEKTEAHTALFSREAQYRKATVDLEGDEWMLLYAQLVRDVCRAKADASAAANAIARNSLRQSEVKGDEGEQGPSSPFPQRKRARAERSSRVTKNSASRRQRAALEAVASLTQPASQYGVREYPTEVYAGGMNAVTHLMSQEHRDNVARVTPNVPVTPPPQPRVPSALRQSYRLTSVKSSAIAKKRSGAVSTAAEARAPISGEKRKLAETVKTGGGRTVHISAMAAARASAMSPFTPAVGDDVSDSSFSLVRSRKSAVEVPDSGSDTSDVPLSTPSPSPRCPPGKSTAAAPPVAAAHPLPRPLLRRGGGDGCLAAPHLLPGSALASALSACTPPCIAIASDVGRVPPHSSLTPNFTGNSAALPLAGYVARLSHTSMRSRAAKTKLLSTPQRRALHLATPAVDVGEDLFADLFS